MSKVAAVHAVRRVRDTIHDHKRTSLDAVSNVQVGSRIWERLQEAQRRTPGIDAGKPPQVVGHVIHHNPRFRDHQVKVYGRQSDFD